MVATSKTCPLKTATGTPQGISTMTDSSVASESEAVRVIIVGAGYAGLGCAIECKRKGHDVVVLEKVETFKILGETYY